MTDERIKIALKYGFGHTKEVFLTVRMKYSSVTMNHRYNFSELFWIQIGYMCISM